VVAAAGNNGLNASGQAQWGGVVSPANAPWVLTVCAFSTRGSYNVADDTVAPFSSAGPTAVDFSAKPDICAPGVGVVSTAAPGSSLFQSGLLSPVSWLLPGTVASLYPYVPYESLTGTSMATPVVSGAIALMLQANPNLTPNLIKGMLEFTAISKPGVSPLRQGAGFLNVSHAVALAALAAHPSATQVPIPTTWARHILWGNHLVSGGVINPTANAWKLGVEWGWARTQADDGDNIVWGTASDGDNIVWGTDCGGADCDNIVWGTSDGDNIVWGTASDGDNIVWGTADDGDNIVWGTANVTNTIWSILKGGK
jgi:serine protease AprX